MREESLPQEEIDQERPAAEELGGESEHSMQEANLDERGSTRRKKRGPPAREPLSADVSELGSRYLEEATTGEPIDREDDEEPVRTG